MILRYWTDANPSKTDMVIPSEFEWNYEDLDKSAERSAETGLLFRERIASKVKLTLTYPYYWSTEFTSMIDTLASAPEFFYVEYPDARGYTRTMECYRTAMNTKLYMASDGNI